MAHTIFFHWRICLMSEAAELQMSSGRALDRHSGKGTYRWGAGERVGAPLPLEASGKEELLRTSARGSQAGQLLNSQPAKWRGMGERTKWGAVRRGQLIRVVMRGTDRQAKWYKGGWVGRVERSLWGGQTGGRRTSGSAGESGMGVRRVWNKKDGKRSRG